jgi:hypothetical protein
MPRVLAAIDGSLAARPVLLTAVALSVKQDGDVAAIHTGENNRR